jgi:hypothetical protein
VSRRFFEITRPFTDGYVSDLAVEQLGPRMAARLENGIFPRELLERRRGWAFDGSTADHSSGTSEAVARVQFQRAAVTKTLVAIGGVSDIRVHNSASAGTVISPTFSSTSVWLPRCVYRDELLFCSQDGVLPLMRYGGGEGSHIAATAVTLQGEERRMTWTANTIPSGSWNGHFFALPIAGQAPIEARTSLYARIDKAVVGASEATVSGVLNGGASGIPIETLAITPYGWAAPCIPFYEAGTVDITVGDASQNATATGSGTLWNTASNIILSPAEDALATFPVDGTAATWRKITAVNSDTSLTVKNSNPAIAETPYKILRRMPYKDAAVFRGCLFGSGVRGRENTVWYLPPGADIGFPPEYFERTWPKQSELLDSAHYFQPSSTNPEVAWVAESVEVPSYFDSDPITALLAADDALYVLKRGSVYRIFGFYPNFRSEIVRDGAGCVDIRSAVADEYGVFWAGDGGVWTVRSGKLFNLCGEYDGGGGNGILTEWRNLLKEGITGPASGSTSWVTCGVAEGHLIVSVRTASGTERCFVYDLKHGVWCGKFMNVLPRHMWSSRIAGEDDKLYAVQDLDARRVEELSPMFRTAAAGSSTAGAVTDGDGGTPLLVAHTGSRVFFPESLSREYRLSHLKIAARVYDTASPSTTVTPSIVYGDQVEGAGDSTEALTGFDADTTNTVKVREYRPGTRGRRQQLQIVQSDQDADFSTIEIHELRGEVRVFGDER